MNRTTRLLAALAVVITAAVGAATPALAAPHVTAGTLDIHATVITPQDIHAT
ncbi:hypothetical protein ACGFW5_22705 [Streptomyces sp. NPDC048416]|uniref:hypothetical protein n=1 Tax=Streptomyces sp. NPDC048416 TaxID=3365546 RepID=UPI003713C8BB